MGTFDLGSVVSNFISKVALPKETKAKELKQTTAVAFTNNVTEPIGDTFVKKATASKSKENVTVEDLMAFVDPSISAKVSKYNKEKPVGTIGDIQNITSANVPEEVNAMATMTGNKGVTFYAKKAYSDGSATRIGQSTEATGELMQYGSKFTDAFYEAMS